MTFSPEKNVIKINIFNKIQTNSNKRELIKLLEDGLVAAIVELYKNVCWGVVLRGNIEAALAIKGRHANLSAPYKQHEECGFQKCSDTIQGD
ncbi:unnamed protein product [Arabis nemorensis]|uniref:Uncharacterized protein n=1 Tax=Arabis nemorensis TaxID=586526 RepID=A0A565AQ21_9BRAS|nr:unnamed protein product [Arabis nemorensis]